MKNIKAMTLDYSNYIIPGFILMLGITDDPFEILDRSCNLCNLAMPFFKYYEPNSKKM